jgi:HAE1 family hydrophobic/amphiphilic exporter-1
MLSSRLLAGDGILTDRFFAALERGHRWLEEVYARTAAAAMRRKGVTLATGFVVVVAGCGVATTIPLDLFTDSDRGEINVGIKLPLGTPLPVTDRVTRRVEAELARHPEVRTLFATVGSSIEEAPHRAIIFVGLSDKSERDDSMYAILDVLRERVTAVAPEVEEVTVAPVSWFSRGGRSSAVMYALRGPDLEQLERYAAQLTARMEADPGYVDVATSFETGRPEIDLEIDRDRAADLGVSAVSIGRTIRALLAGERVGTYEEGGRRIDVRVQVLPEYRDDPEELDLIRLRSVSGKLVPITNLAHPRMGEGAVQIVRENRARKIDLYANLADDMTLGTATQRLEEWGREIGIAAPYEMAAWGRARAMGEAVEGIVFAFTLATIAIYMILASLFNSALQPLVIMISAPLSFIGGFLGLKLFGADLELMSMIGLLVLMGLVMKNGILVVDFANQLRAEGKPCDEAVLQAGRMRMRPVLMTTAALVCGLLPVALGVSPGSEGRRPMAVITVGGLLSSTPLTLVFVPVIYTLMDGLGMRMRRVASRFLPGAGLEAGGNGADERASGSRS